MKPARLIIRLPRDKLTIARNVNLRDFKYIRVINSTPLPSVLCVLLHTCDTHTHTRSVIHIIEVNTLSAKLLI